MAMRLLIQKETTYIRAPQRRLNTAFPSPLCLVHPIQRLLWPSAGNFLRYCHASAWHGLPSTAGCNFAIAGVLANDAGKDVENDCTALNFHHPESTPQSTFAIQIAISGYHPPPFAHTTKECGAWVGTTSCVSML
jgi:hypothetical protein